MSIRKTKIWAVSVLDTKFIQNIFEILPILAPVLIALYGLVAIPLLILHFFHPVLILGLYIPTSAFVSYLIYSNFPYIDQDKISARIRLLIDFLVLILVVVWIVINSYFSSQHIFTNRDPATYAQAGIWLMKNNNLLIEKTDGFAVKGVESDSGGFSYNNANQNVIEAQGQHLLPAFLGLAGKIGGIKLLLHTNPIFGGVMLLAFYGFVSMLLGRRWGLVAVTALAVSLPLIYFSRDTYTEPLSAIFVFGSLSLIYAAQRLKNNKSATLFWLLAGLTAGAGGLTRIDVYLSMFGLVVFAILMIMFAPKEKRKFILKNMLLFGAGIALMCFIGWLDLVSLSYNYYNASLKYYLAELIAMVALIIFAPLAILLSWKTKFLKKIDKITKKQRGIIAFLIILLFGVALLSRPLWLEQHASVENGLVAGLQASEGVEVEPTRRYTENSLQWLMWYGGPVMVILGFIGVAIAARNAMYDKNMIYIPALGVLFGALAVYAVFPAITPDHIWVARRYLPVVIPGLIFFAILALRSLFKSNKLKRYGNTGIIFAVISGTLLVIQPYYTSKPFLTLRTHSTQLDRINAVCDSVPDDAVILWLGTGRTQAVQPTKAICNIPALGYGDKFQKDKPSKETLTTFYKQAQSLSLKPYVALYGSEVDILPNKDIQLLDEVYVGTNFDIEQTLTRKPINRSSNQESVVIGLLNYNGAVVREIKGE